MAGGIDAVDLGFAAAIGMVNVVGTKGVQAIRNSKVGRQMMTDGIQISGKRVQVSADDFDEAVRLFGKYNIKINTRIERSKRSSMERGGDYRPIPAE